MSEEQPNTTAPVQETTTSDYKTLQNDFNGLYGKHKEAQRTIEAFQKEAAEREAATLAANDKAAADRGEFDTVLAGKDELIKSLQVKAGYWDTHETDTRTKFIEQLPEDQREKASKAPLDILELMVKNLGVSNGVNVATGAPGSGIPVGMASAEEIRQNIANPEWRKANATRLGFTS